MRVFVYEAEAMSDVNHRFLKDESGYLVYEEEEGTE